MRRFGLIGETLAYSFSKDYFQKKFTDLQIRATYENFELAEIEEVAKLLSIEQLSGLNVTIPYKEAVIPFLDEIDPTAKEVGSVNTIKFKNGKTIGYNTDVIGFENSLKPFLEHGMDRALILGTGGASKAVAYVLKKIGLDLLFVSRNPSGSNEISYQECNSNAVKWHRLIVNTTPVGTSPNITDAPPIAYKGITKSHLLYDLIYNPPKTLFLKEGEARGASIQNGLSMLKIQAEKSWDIWNSET
ncbi:shikimate dehydrogenase [Cryomorphaceae bacterium 1068]|nr:shikimate dehydrogenase [Cryomorphaceae bacterium 1068]